MRRPRGNIILTALFISVFLFFLSIALIWTNRQDIALSLAMEHKMKGEAAARSGAMRVYASLRNLGMAPSTLEGTLDNGATWKCELVELPPEGDRGPLVLLHCRGTSGPLSTYYTMHLLKTDLGKELDGSMRMLTFLQGGGGGGTTPPAEEGGASATETTTTAAAGTISSQAKVLNPDFVLKSIDLNLEEQVTRAAAYQGPLFISSRASQDGSPLQTIAFIPVFSLSTGALMAYGPVVLNLPPVTENVLSYMALEGDQFSWKRIPFPVAEPDDPNPPPLAALDLQAPSAGNWTTLAVRTIDEVGSTNLWRDSQPATSVESEAQDLQPGAGFEIELSRVIDWGAAKTTKPKRGYALQGAIAAYRENVYSYGWEYLYKHYGGMTLTPPIPSIAGSTITRWPCVRKYNISSKKWSTAWSALKDGGDVSSSEVPDMNEALVANNDGICWGLTGSTPKRLLRMDSSGSVDLGPEVPSGKLFLYRDQPHSLSDDPKKPGIKNLITNAVIGFDSLPSRLPEILGPVVTQMANEDLTNIGLAPIEVSPVSGQSPETPEICTVRPQYDITYQVDSTSSMAADGDNLYANLIVTVTKKAPSYEMFGTFGLSGSGGKVLARYDGQRWHILPHGLMPLLTGDGSLSTPGNDMYCPYYKSKDKAKSRYTVVSIDTDPFEFSQ